MKNPCQMFAAALLLSQTATGAIQVFTDESLFITAIGPHTHVDFESAVPGAYGTTAMIGGFTFSSPPSTLTVNTSPHSHGAKNTTPAGTRYLFGDSGVPAFHDDLTVTAADGSMVAWGAMFTDLEVGPIVFRVNGVIVVNQAATGSSGQAQFFGFLATGSDSIASVTLSIPDITYGIDDVRAVTCRGYGTGCAGTGGFVPELSTSPCGTIVNGTQITVQVSEGLGGAPLVLFFGLNQAALPIGGGCTLNIAPVLPGLVSVPLGGVGPGNGGVILTGIMPASAAGVTFTMQGFVGDNGSPIGFTATNGVQLTVL